MTHKNQKYHKLGLMVGYLLISIAITIAYTNPAVTYEPSIYIGTPLIFWVAIIASLLISIYISFSSLKKKSRSLGIVMGVVSIVSIVLLPLVRGYYFLGQGDGLTHVGRTRDLSAGLISMVEFRYPVTHTFGSVLSDFLSIDLFQALLLFTLIIISSFVIFIPLVVRELITNHHRSRIVYIGVFSGFLFLPINFFAVTPSIHPSTLAIMYSPFVLYTLLMVYKRNYRAYTVLFLITSTMFVLFHPLHGANFVILSGTIAIVYLSFSTLKENSIWSSNKFVLPVTTAFIVIFWLWVGDLNTFSSAFGGFVNSLISEPVAGAGSEIVSRGESLKQIGGSYEEVFIKLFFIPFVYCIFTVLLILNILLNKFGLNIYNTHISVPADLSNQRLLFCISIGFIFVSFMFPLYLLADIGDQYFRHYGFIMTIVTVLGSITLGRLFVLTDHRRSNKIARRLLLAVCIITVLFSIPVIHPSPYIYQTSGHVTEAEISGYETIFHYESESIAYDHVRSSASRYGHALQGIKHKDRRDYHREGTRLGGLPDHFANQQLHLYIREPIYLTITRTDRVRDAKIYKGLRYNRDDFRYLDKNKYINKIYKNNEFDVYLVTSNRK